MLNLFYTNSSIFVDVNVDVEYVIRSDLVLFNNFINYEVLSLPAFDFHFMGLESSQLLHIVIVIGSLFQVDIKKKKKKKYKC